MKQTSILFHSGKPNPCLPLHLNCLFLFVVDKNSDFIKDKGTHDNNNQSELCQHYKTRLRINQMSLVKTTNNSNSVLLMTTKVKFAQLSFVKKPRKPQPKQCCIFMDLLTTSSKQKWLNSSISMVTTFTHLI